MRRPRGHTKSDPGQDPRWQAVLHRDAAAAREFVYAVKTTGIYCRSTCPSRRPAPKNVEFFRTPTEAERGGYRPCKRCWPVGEVDPDRAWSQIRPALALLGASEERYSLARLAEACGLSKYHFQRTFKARVGMTPKAYESALRMQRVRDRLRSPETTVTSALYEAGFSSSSRFYAQAVRRLGMPPSDYKKRGHEQRILFAVGECSLGAIVVGSTEVGVCAILLGDDAEEVLADLQDRFRNAELIPGDDAYEQVVARVIGLVEGALPRLDLPTDLRGTVFQHRVWEALAKIPAGTTATYTEVAQAVGAPSSHRAVARACGANPLAVAIPCHRVVRKDGGLSGYRWGIERKRRLLNRERTAAGRPDPAS